jgi:hypothetical protein
MRPLALKNKISMTSAGVESLSKHLSHKLKEKRKEKKGGGRDHQLAHYPIIYAHIYFLIFNF